jgi:hypothetical protein
MDMIYLGIDPGVRTGIAWISTDNDELVLLGSTEVYDGADGLIGWWGGPRWAVAPDLIVFEGFTLREGKNGVDITPRDVIGALKANASRDGIPWAERASAGRKKQVSDAVLKRLGLYLAGEPNRNAREAVRHVICHLKTLKHPVVLSAFR